MAIAAQSSSEVRTGLQELAKRHLWMHFSRMGSYGEDHEIPIIVRGEGCYVFDEHGNRYLDGLSALFCVNAGHGRTELGEAAARQVEELDFYTLWSYAHPRAIELAARLASLAPEGLDRVFFTNGGSEAVESALKLARNYHRMLGKGQKHKVIAREIAYHGTSLGALSATGITDLRAQFEPLAPGGCHVPNTNVYRWPEERHPLWAANAIEERIEFEGAGHGRRGDPRAGPERRWLLRPARRLLPAGPRDLRPPRRADDLRRGDLRDGPPRPLLRLRALRVRARHHHDGEGDHLGLRADGGDGRLRPRRRAVHGGRRLLRPRLHLRRAPGGGGDRDGQPRHLRERGPLRPRARAKEGEFRQMLESLRDLPIVGDVRGAGYFQAIELVKDKETKESFDDEESEDLLRGFLSGELYRRGLICRADDRGDPVIQLAPPLIADTEQFAEIHDVLRDVLEEAGQRIRR